MKQLAKALKGVPAVAGDLQQAVLYLPASFAGKLCIYVENGALTIADFSFSELTAETKNGSKSVSATAPSR